MIWTAVYVVTILITSYLSYLFADWLMGGLPELDNDPLNLW